MRTVGENLIRIRLLERAPLENWHLRWYLKDEKKPGSEELRKDLSGGGNRMCEDQQ